MLQTQKKELVKNEIYIISADRRRTPGRKMCIRDSHDIFVRELVSNGCDAITKLKKLEMMGECEIAEDEKLKVEIIVNSEDKTMIVRDNGCLLYTSRCV